MGIVLQRDLFLVYVFVSEIIAQVLKKDGIWIFCVEFHLQMPIVVFTFVEVDVQVVRNGPRED